MRDSRDHTKWTNREGGREAVVRTPAEQAARLAGEMQALADRLREGEQDGAALFTREDVDRIVSERVARELKKRRRLEGELEELRQGREDAVLRTARAGLRGCSIAAWERTVQADQGRPANRPAMRPGAG